MAEPIIRNHRDLKVWRHSVKLTRECYRLAAKLPASEEHAKDQLRRASTAVCNAIVEGTASATRPECANYAQRGRASVNEVRGEIDLCVGLGLLAATDVARALDLADQISAMLWVLRDRLLTSGPETLKDLENPS